MKRAADVRMKNAANERLTALGTAKEASAAEELAVEIAGAADMVTGVVSIEAHEILIDVAREDQDLPYLDVETHEIGDHFVVLHHQEISIPTSQVVEVIAGEMSHAVDRLQPLCRQGIRLRDHAQLHGVGVAQTQDPSHHIRDAGPRRLTEIAEATVVEVVEVEEGVQTTVIVGDPTRLPMTPGLGLRRLASEEEALRSPQVHLLHRGCGIVVEEIHRLCPGPHLPRVTARATEWSHDETETQPLQVQRIGI
jgi:hypothetical protein